MTAKAKLRYTGNVVVKVFRTSDGKARVWSGGSAGTWQDYVQGDDTFKLALAEGDLESNNEAELTGLSSVEVELYYEDADDDSPLYDETRYIGPDGEWLDTAQLVRIGSAVLFGKARPHVVQTITLTGSPTGGSWRVGYGGQSATVAYNASTAALQTALRALTTIGDNNVTVTGAAGAWVCTFGGGMDLYALSLMTAVATALTGGTSPDVVVTTTVQFLDTADQVIATVGLNSTIGARLTSVLA